MTPKSNKERIIPLIEEICECLLERKQEKGYVFSVADGRHISNMNSYRKITQHLRSSRG